jgi:hypothetical protein
MASLEAQMLQYAQNANDSARGSVDFKALQYAIQTNNFVSAQTALARLHRDTQPVTPPATSIVPPESASTPAPADPLSIDITA